MTTTTITNARPRRAPRRIKLRVSEVMTEQPLTIGRDQTLAVVHEFMRKNHIRHLPVLDRGKIVGVVSQRDLYFLETIAGVDMDDDKVEDAMNSDTYAVGPDAPLAEVAATMAKRKLGCAVIVHERRVVGIFTATDALRVLASET